MGQAVDPSIGNMNPFVIVFNQYPAVISRVITICGSAPRRRAGQRGAAGRVRLAGAFDCKAGPGQMLEEADAGFLKLQVSIWNSIDQLVSGFLKRMVLAGEQGPIMQESQSLPGILA